MKRLVAVLAVVLIVATACGSSGEPETFNEQFAELSEAEKAAFGMSDDFIPVELRNWMEGCVAGAGQGDGVTAPTNTAAACKCSFDGIVEFLLDFSEGVTPEEVERNAFASFKRLDSAAEDALEGQEPFQSDIRDIIDGCGT